MEKNELNKNARGGTELMQERLHTSLPADLLDKFQIIPSRVRELDSDKKHILWLHDLPQDPESSHLTDPKSRARFDKIVCVSNWQLQLYNLLSSVPYSECTVIKNAIYPIEVDKKEYDGTVRLIYHTTPHRGLEILVPVFEELCKKYDNLHLDVYSSFKIYGWPDRDEMYKQVIDRCKDNPKITYHGSVSNEEIRQALTKSHIFAYPSIWPETSCLAMIEAMSAKNLCVYPNFAVLPETGAGFGYMYPFKEDKHAHAMQFAHTLSAVIDVVINQYEESQGYLEFQKMYFDYFYDWNRRKTEWVNLLESLN